MHKDVPSRYTAVLLVALSTTCCQNRKEQQFCASFHNASVDADWGKLTQQAHQCLPPDDVKVFDGSAARGVMLVHSGEGWTVQQVLDEARAVEKQAKNFQLPDLEPSTPSSESQQARVTEEDVATFLSETLPKSVVYLFESDDAGGPSKEKPLGTGFLVSVPSKKSHDRSLFLLFTARHILDPHWANPNPLQRNWARVYMRLNKREIPATGSARGVTYVPIDLVSDGKPRFSVPVDDAVDAATVLLMPGSVPFQELDVRFIPISIFATDEELAHVKLRTNVFSEGFIPGIGTDSTNEPLPKDAHIIGMPSEPENAHYSENSSDKPVRVWLISSSLPPGYSGAPMMAVVKRQLRGQTTPGPVLIGIQSMSLSKKSGDVAGITPLPTFLSLIDQLARFTPEADVTRGFSSSDGQSIKH